VSTTVRRRRLRRLSRTGSAGPALLRLEDLSGTVLLLEVPLGSVEITLRDLLALEVGSVLRLDRLTGEPLDVTAHGTPVARGEVRVQGERFAVRLTEILGAGALDGPPGTPEPAGAGRASRSGPTTSSA